MSTPEEFLRDDRRPTPPAPPTDPRLRHLLATIGETFGHLVRLEADLTRLTRDAAAARRALAHDATQAAGDGGGEA